MNKNLVAITDCDHDDIEVESKALAKEGLEAVCLPARQRKISFVSVRDSNLLLISMRL